MKTLFLFGWVVFASCQNSNTQQNPSSNANNSELQTPAEALYNDEKASASHNNRNSSTVNQRQSKAQDEVIEVQDDKGSESAKNTSVSSHSQEQNSTGTEATIATSPDAHNTTKEDLREHNSKEETAASAPVQEENRSAQLPSPGLKQKEDKPVQSSIPQKPTGSTGTRNPQTGPAPQNSPSPGSSNDGGVKPPAKTPEKSPTNPSTGSSSPDGTNKPKPAPESETPVYEGSKNVLNDTAAEHRKPSKQSGRYPPPKSAPKPYDNSKNVLNDTALERQVVAPAPTKVKIAQPKNNIYNGGKNAIADTAAEHQKSIMLQPQKRTTIDDNKMQKTATPAVISIKQKPIIAPAQVEQTSPVQTNKMKAKPILKKPAVNP